MITTVLCWIGIGLATLAAAAVVFYGVGFLFALLWIKIFLRFFKG